MKTNRARTQVSRLLTGASLAALLMSLSPAALAQPPGGATWREGRVLVQPRAGVAEARLAEVLGRHGGRSVGKITGIGVHLVQVPPQAEAAVARALGQQPEVQFAEVDMLVPLDAVPNDPQFASQWHLPLIGANQAWDSSTGEGILVAILDSGVDGNHPDLAERMVPGWNFYDNNADWSDVRGHGTKVAGVVAAQANNGVGVAGVASGARLLPVRVSSADGYAYWSTMAQGITWAADRGARVANASFSATGSATVQSAARYLRGKGGLLVVSAGNTGALVATPEDSSMITVSATTRTDARASWSSYGEYVDLSAPGDAILTTALGGGYATVSGTSFSSPCTAGVVALMMSANPALSPDQVESLLLETTRDLGTMGWDPYFGHGRVDALAAVQAAAAAVTRDTQAPTVVIDTLPGTVAGVVAVTVTAADNTAVAEVDLYVNGNLYATDAAAPFGFAWDTTRFADGIAVLEARALDSTGNLGVSRTVSVAVDNVPEPVDATPPAVALTNPVSGAVVDGRVSIAATAADNVGVALLEILVDDQVLCVGNQSPLTCTWNTRKVAQGAHSITARARDAAGNAATAQVQVTLGTDTTTDTTTRTVPPGKAKK